jgi:predicted transcriptional regulator
MQLIQWQHNNNISNVRLAEMIRKKKVKCDPSMVSHYHAGRKCFSPKVSMVIEDISNGLVTLRDIFSKKKNKGAAAE